MRNFDPNGCRRIKYISTGSWPWELLSRDQAARGRSPLQIHTPTAGQKYMKRGREDDEERGERKIYNIDSNQVNVEEDGSCLVCMLPPCNKRPTRFRTNDEFETHYYQLHCMNCSQCGRMFPSEHILNLHITENHDSFSQARKARGDKIYGCMLESCDRFCSEEWKRRRHVIDKHGYPPNFHFGVVKHGLSKKNCNIKLN
jgi:hypothetical protein